MVTNPPPQVTKLVVERVNGTRQAVAPGATLPLCNAIFPTAIEVRVRARAERITLVAHYPGGTERRHRATVRRGRARVKLWASDERLPHGAFTAGRYRFTVRAAGRRTTAPLTFTGGGNC